jgi:hypothetical protein
MSGPGRCRAPRLSGVTVFGDADRAGVRPVRWLILCFGCGLFGQLMSYLWLSPVGLSYLWLSPVGAGNSMCVAGLIGGLTVVIMLAGRRYGVVLPLQFRVIALVVPVLAVVDTVVHDNHGLPCLLGLALGFLLLPAAELPRNANVP